MIYLLKKASDDYFQEEIEITTMEDLRALWTGRRFVIDFENMEITIYDDYLE